PSSASFSAVNQYAPAGHPNRSPIMFSASRSVSFQNMDWSSTGGRLFAQHGTLKPEPFEQIRGVLRQRAMLVVPSELDDQPAHHHSAVGQSVLVGNVRDGQTLDLPQRFLHVRVGPISVRVEFS